MSKQKNTTEHRTSTESYPKNGTIQGFSISPIETVDLNYKLSFLQEYGLTWKYSVYLETSTSTIVWLG